MDNKEALSEYNKLMECPNKDYKASVKILKEVSNPDANVLLALLDSLLKIGTSDAISEAKLICEDSTLTDNYRGSSKAGDLYYEGKIFEKDLSKACFLYKKAISKGAHWKVKNLYDALHEIGSEDSLSEMIALGEKYQDSDAAIKTRLARAYRDGTGVTPDIHKSKKLLKSAINMGATWSAHEYIDLLLKIGTPDSLSELYEYCMDNDGKEWSKRHLIKMYWCGIGVDENRPYAEKMQIEYINGNNRVVNSTSVLNNKVFDYDSFTVAGSEDNIKRILSLTYQSGLFVNNVLSTTDEKTLCGLVPIKSIYEKNMHTHDALLMANADYESCIDSHIDLSGFQALFVLDGQMGTNPLCIKNPILDKPTIINFSENVFSCHSDKNNEQFSSIDELCKFISSNTTIQFTLDTDDWMKIMARFRPLGLKSHNVFVDLDKYLFSKGCYYIVYNSFMQRTISDVIYEYCLGEVIYNLLKQEPSRFIFQMLGGIGDEFRRLCRTNAYRDANGYSSVRPIIRERSRDIATIYGYDCVILSDIEADSLSSFIRINHLYDRNNIFVIEPWLSRYSEKISLTLCIGKTCCDPHTFNTNVLPGTPCDPINYLPLSNQIPQISNAVLLNPSGFTMFSRRPGMKKIFLDLFDYLAEELISRGIKVYTNVVKPGDYVIKNTMTMFYSLKELVSMCRYYKHIVTIETSIAELLSQTDCNITVVHTGDVGLFKTIADMCDHTNCFSIVFNENDNEQTILKKRKTILNQILNSEPVATLKGNEELFDYSSHKPQNTISDYALSFCELYPLGSEKLLRRIKLMPLSTNIDQISDFIDGCVQKGKIKKLIRYLNIVHQFDSNHVMAESLRKIKQDSFDTIKRLISNHEFGNIKDFIPTGPLNFDPMNRKIETFDIWGCCVSRDMFGIPSDYGYGSQYPSRISLQDNQFYGEGSRVFKYQINEYYQGCPISVEYTPHKNLNGTDRLKNINMDGALLKWFLASYNKDISETLNKTNSEWLIIDFRSEAYSRLLLKYSDGDVEFSCGIRDIDKGKQIMESIGVADSVEVITAKEDVEEEQLNKFIRFVKNRYGNKVIVIEARDAFFMLNKMGSVDDFNCFKRYVAIQEEYISRFIDSVDCYLIRSPFLLCADALQKWGAGGVHYISECYDYLLSCVRCIVESNDIDTHRNLDKIYAKYSSRIARIMNTDIESLNNAIKRAEEKANNGNPEEAVKIYKELAANREPIAYAYLGRSYRDGKGVPQDIDQALLWMRKASNCGIVWSKNELFDMLWKIDTPEAQREMYDVSNELSQAGNGGAMLRLGRLYRDGKFVVKDQYKALEWMRKASKTTAFGAKEDYIDILFKIGTEPLLREAFESCKKWAENGDANMMLRLSKMYLNGRCVDKNIPLSKTWADLALKKKPNLRKEYDSIMKEINDASVC